MSFYIDLNRNFKMQYLFQILSSNYINEIWNKKEEATH